MMGVAGNRTMLSKNDGVVAYSTIVSVSESPVMPGVVWAGTDDGNLQVSRDGGISFTEVGRNLPGLPANHVYWISRIDASHFEPGTAYMAVDYHLVDSRDPYLAKTTDLGCGKWRESSTWGMGRSCPMRVAGQATLVRRLVAAYPPAMAASRLFHAIVVAGSALAVSCGGSTTEPTTGTDVGVDASGDAKSDSTPADSSIDTFPGISPCCLDSALDTFPTIAFDSGPADTGLKDTGLKDTFPTISIDTGGKDTFPGISPPPPPDAGA